MKSKLFRVLGVVAVVAMLATSLVAPVAANVGGVQASVASGTSDINATGNFTIFATLGTQLLGSSTVTKTFPYVGESITFTAVAGTDQVKVVVTGSAVTPSGTGSYNATTGMVTFTAAAQTVILTTTSAATVIAYTKTVGNAGVGTSDLSGLPTTASPGAFTLPDAGDTIVITGIAADVATFTSTSTLVATWGTATGTYVAGVLTFTTGGTVSLSSAAAQVTGSWAQTTGTPTGAAGVNVPNLISTATTVNGDSITVTFPTGFTVPGPIAGSISGNDGWLVIPPALPPATSQPAVITPTWSFNSTNLTVTATLAAGDHVGAGAQLLINITGGVKNPATAGAYAVTVKTSQETTATTSNTFNITNPTITPLAGVATVYNNVGTPMFNTNDFGAAVNYVNVAAIDGFVIKLTPGTYTTTTTWTTFPSSAFSVSILGQGATAGDVILKNTGAWSLTGKTIVIDKVTIDNSTGALTVNAATGGTSLISNSVLKGGVTTLAGIAPTLDTDTVTVATGAVGIATSVTTTVKNSTFNVTGTGIGIVSTGALTLSGSTFTGTTATAGNGYGVNQSGIFTSTIGTSKFTGLTNALTIGTGSTITINGNTIDTCGSTTAPTGDAITVNAGVVAVTVTNNTIVNSPAYFINVASGVSPVVNVMNNTFKNNTKNAKGAAGLLNVTHNFWSGVAAPASTTTEDYDFALGAASTAANFTVTTIANGTFDANTTLGTGVFFTATTSTIGSVLGANLLSANPVTQTLPATVTVKRYYDVFAFQTPILSPVLTMVTDATIRLYGPTGTTMAATDTVYYYSFATALWTVLPASTNPTVNIAFNYISFKVPGDYLIGTPFALVSMNPAAPSTVGTDTTYVSPALGAINVSLTPTFTWGAITGADHYDFVIAEDLGAVNKFDIIDYSNTTAVNATVAKETLKANTTYWWRVRSVGTNGLASAWSQYFFTTGNGVTSGVTSGGTTVTTITSIVISTNPPVTTIVTTQPITITNTSTPTEAIPTYLLWAVILVGAVLIISVIVLIVRTRKI